MYIYMYIHISIYLIYIVSRHFANFINNIYTGIIENVHKLFIWQCLLLKKELF